MFQSPRTVGARKEFSGQGQAGFVCWRGPGGLGGAGGPHRPHRSVWKCRCPGHSLRQPYKVELSMSVRGPAVFVSFGDCLHTKFWPSLVLHEGWHMEMQVGSPSALALRVCVGSGTPRGSGKYGLP